MRNQRTYFLDLQTLLTYLSGQSCELLTELRAAGVVVQGSIMLREGKIVHCVLSFRDGSQITGELAYKQLATCTQWRVELEQRETKSKTLPLTPAPSQSAPFFSRPSAPAGNSGLLPPLRQKGPLDLALLQGFPLKKRLILRSVFSMVDGKRSSAEIKAQLPLFPKDIDDALARLRALDLIE